MKTTYSVKGMHCGSCVGKVEKAIAHLGGVTSVHVDLAKEEAHVESREVLSLEALSNAVAKAGKYTITQQLKKSRLEIFVKKAITFLPLIIIFSLVALWTLSRQYLYGANLMDAMLDFMGGFFLVFGSLKVASWKAFAVSFRSYDPLAQRSGTYAMLYPAIEIMLGIAYQFRSPDLIYANFTTIVILSATTFGVLKKINEKCEIKCACLGGFFNIPLSWFTVFENVLMIAMAATMLVMPLLK